MIKQNIRPRASEVEALDNYKLLVTFNNGEKRIFDFNPYLVLKPFENLKNEALFKTVRIAGLSVEWINGEDICPDELYYDSVPVEDLSKKI